MGRRARAFSLHRQDRPKKRPALVLSNRAFNTTSGHTVMAMITKRDNSAWPQDYEVGEWKRAGLLLPSWIRLKIFTLENRLILDRLGVLDAPDIEGFRQGARIAIW